MENNEMTNREMLEFAAKAYGFGSDSGGFIWTESEYPRGSSTNGALWNYRGWCDTSELWNPLNDDGDALRLAAALSMRIDLCSKTGCEARYGVDCENVIYVLFDANRDLHKAARLAITKAAAEIGKRMA